MILITGGYGYLGGRIASHLLLNGKQVRIGSHRASPTIPEELKGCEHVYIDLSNIESLQNSCDGATHLIHLAALNASECKDNPEQAHLVNVVGTKNVLRAAEESGVARCIYFSTAHVYGSPLHGELDETSQTNPTHPYAITHRKAEEYVVAVGKRGTLKTVVFRVSNAVGSPLTADTNCWMLVVNDLCKQIALEHEMNLRSSPSLLRDYVPISAICSILQDVIQQDLFQQDTINISSGESISLQELATMISDRAKQQLSIDVTVSFEQPKQEAMELHISNQKLLGLGTVYPMSLSDEIDVLLQNSSRWFDGSGHQ